MCKMMAGAGWARWWNSLLMLLLVAALNPALAREVTPDTAAVSEQGLLWQIVPPAGGKVNYLFGTIHSEDTRVTTLAAPVQIAFDRSTRYVMEIIPDQASMVAASQAMLLDQGSSLRALVGAPLFEKSVRILRELGVPPEAADRFKPWAAMVIMSMPKAETGQVLDLLLYSSALKAGKVRAGLESAMEQLAIFDNLPLAEQKELLAETVTLYPQMQAMLEQMHVAYLARDLAKLAALSAQYGNMGNAKLASKVNAALVDQRNLRMAERMDSYLREGGAFVAVGALHLPGEQGLLSLLRKRGYRVVAIY